MHNGSDMMDTVGGSREQVVGTVMRQLDAAEGRLPELPRAALQNVTTAVAALTVVLVALTYLFGIAALVWLTVDYGISHARLLSAQNAGGSVLIYLIVAFVALLFVPNCTRPPRVVLAVPPARMLPLVRSTADTSPRRGVEALVAVLAW